jgi:hypothetical protein
MTRSPRYLPWFQLYDPYVTREITVRDLLTHRAGLGNADMLWYQSDNTPQDVLRLIRYARPAYSFRSGWIYQNVMYAGRGRGCRGGERHAVGGVHPDPYFRPARHARQCPDARRHERSA